MTEQNLTQAEKYRIESEQFHVLVDTVTDHAIYMLDSEGRVKSGHCWINGLGLR